MIGKLKAATLAEFIRKERSDDCLWIFLHIPKTAGTSLGFELNRVRSPYANIHVDFATSAPFGVQISAAVDRFLEQSRTKKFRSCSGHLSIDLVRRIKAEHPDSKIVTFVRNPTQRVISAYRYQRTDAHPLRQRFIDRFPTLESYTASDESQNEMSRYMVGAKKIPIEDMIKIIDEEYSFVGTVENYPMSFNVFFNLMGCDIMPRERRNETVKNADNSLDVSNDVMNAIRRGNDRDCAIYAHVSEILRSKREEWVGIRRAHHRARDAMQSVGGPN